MRRYAIYGSCLASTVEFPELRPATDMLPKWTFETTPLLDAMSGSVELGAELIYGDVHARLFRHAAGFRITVDDTGIFDLSQDKTRVTWQDRAESWPDFVRAHLMGRVLATSLFLDGWLPLHGSAVSFDAGAIAFLGPKGFGKSSLALALTGMGARLVTDDTLPVELTPIPRAWPGVHSMRVHDDALAVLGDASGRAGLTREGKVLVNGIAPERLLHSAVPLRALYLLLPVEANAATSAPQRMQMPETIATVAIVSQVKIARMLGATAGPQLLERAATLATTVPVYHLATPRDLSLLPSTAARIAEWHTAPGGRS